jgi:hypothetical protein
MEVGMRKRTLGLMAAVAVALGMTLPGEAGNSTLVYTTAQSLAIRNRLIPKYNRDHCAQFALPPACTSAELVTAGCAVVTIRTLVLDSCTIFPSNAAGEEAFLQEIANKGAMQVFNDLIRQENLQFNSAACIEWRAMTTQQRQDRCTALGQPTDCEGPCP